VLSKLVYDHDHDHTVVTGCRISVYSFWRQAIYFLIGPHNHEIRSSGVV